ncbi:MAG: hypothetical protein PHX61_02455 [Alphaproteobacteria bacterium]|nr:hypothetical protein [Alphaproteobacteria bacterium]
MTSKCVSKEKLIARLKQARCAIVDDGNEQRTIYQMGRNILVDVLLVEIAFGDLDAEDPSVTKG